MPDLSYLFTDLRGFLMGVNRLGEAPPSETSPWPRASVSGALIPGWESDANSDLQLIADPQSVFVDGLAGDHRFTFAQPVLPGQALGSYPKDVRAVATRAEAWLRDTGLADEARVGIELEFHLFKGIRFATSMHQNLVEIQSQDGWDNNAAEFGTGYRVGHRSMQYHLGPTDAFAALREAIGRRIAALGIGATHHGHEAGPSQQEIALAPVGLRQAADQIQLVKHMVRTEAIAGGMTATFMPRPQAYAESNGMHINFSLWRDGRNVFFDADAPSGQTRLSRTALGFIAGVLRHLRPLNALTNPTVNSYKRLNHFYSLMRPAGWGLHNRTCAIRVPHFDGPQDCRLEIRFPDASANPYLALAALLCAGVDGIRQELAPPEAESSAPKWYEAPFHAGHCHPQAMAPDLRVALEALVNGHGFLTGSGVFQQALVDALVQDASFFWHWAATTPAPQEYQVFFGH